MMVGMAIFGGASALLNPTGFVAALLEHLDARYLLMTAFMAAPMALLMRLRGHSWERTAEIIGAMLLPVAAACLLWRFGLGAIVPALSDDTLGTVSHVAMYLGMLAVMLYRFGDYAHAARHTSLEPGTPLQQKQSGGGVAPGAGERI